MGGNERHLYRVSLQAGEFLQVRVDQRGVDIALQLLSAGGSPLADMDSPNGTEGFEVLSWVADKEGDYVVVASTAAGGGETGSYTITREASRRATESDRRRVEVELLFREAVVARDSSDEAKRATASQKFESALSGWEELKDAYMSGLTDAQIRLLKGPAPLIKGEGEDQGLSSTHNMNGRSVRVPLKYGEQFQATVRLRKGEVLRLDAEEHNINAALNVAKVSGDSKATVLAQSHYGGGYESETITFIAEQDDEYLILAEPEPEFSVDKDGWVRLTPLIRANTLENDRQRAAAERLMFEYYKFTSRGFTDQNKQALEKLEEAAPLWRIAGDVYWEGYTLTQMGSLYSSLDRTDKALSCYTLALRLMRAARSKSGEAAVLSSLGLLYSHLGDAALAIDSFQKVSALWKEIGNKRGEAGALNEICDYDRLFDGFDEQLECYMRALSLYREDENALGEAMMQNNVGLFYRDHKKYPEAKEHFEQALSIYQREDAPDRVLLVSVNLAYVYADQGEKDKALEPTLKMLGFSMQSGSTSLEAGVYYDLSYTWDTLGNKPLAIFYGKLAVNDYQELRQQILGLDKQLQRTFLKRIENTYRRLADRLIAQGRLAEALQVIELFKDQQFFDFRDDTPTPVRKLDLTDKEKAAAQLLESIREKVRLVGKPYLELRADAEVSTERTKITPEEEARLKQLEQQLQAALDEHKKVHSQIEKDFDPANFKDSSIGDTAESRSLRNVLRDLSTQTRQKVVAVYTIVCPDTFRALVVTPDGISPVSQPVKAAALNEKALQLWGLLQSDKYDPAPLARELYSIVFKPLEGQIPPDTKTILWSLDGNLRYLPMGVLHDETGYLVSRYNHVVITRADPERLTRPVSTRWTGIGLGGSRAYTVELQGEKISFNSLPGVGEELRAVFRQQGGSDGIIDGEVLPDDRFTKATMLAALGHRLPLVHIASHFNFRPGDEERSFLLLGDGSVMTLKEMKSKRDLFAGVELLTLSACNTAAQQPDANGREIDGFAELAQRLGASAVMATLWPAADNSTPWLMREFYRIRQDAHAANKAEALRMAQLALLNGTAQVKPLPEGVKGASQPVQIVITREDGVHEAGGVRAEIVRIAAKDAPPFKRDESKPFAHPHYWAPFILIGNWR
jgi:CHAT domain-containing protein